MSVVLTADDILRALRRMAHELVEGHHDLDRLILLGVRTRGVPLAERLAAHVAAVEKPVATGALDTTLYRDDYASAGPRPVGRTDLPGSIDGRTVVLVDDVLYTGRTVRAALDALTDLGRPSAVRLAVLVDRGHRELPIRPDIVGKNLPSAPDDHVVVRLEEIDGRDEVELLRAEPTPHADDATEAGS
nr:bifunctional pyr operon transcriptional regulator/uracil phosphoribosyltransferase PyrR [Egibacter rhizosphaerae]